MAVRGVFRVEHIGLTPEGDIAADVTYLGFEAGRPVDSGFAITLARGLTAEQLNQEVAAAVRGRLESAHGYVLDVLDSVERL